MVDSIAFRTPNASAANTIVAMMGQTQICLFRNTPVRVTVRPTLLDAHVISANRGLVLDFNRRNRFIDFMTCDPKPANRQVRMGSNEFAMWSTADVDAGSVA
jgi:hypothetical protein